MCFLQFLTSQGDILKLIYVGAAVNANVFKRVGVEQVWVGASSRSLWVTKVTGPSSRYMKVSSGCARLSDDFPCKSVRITLRFTLEYEEDVWKTTD